MGWGVARICLLIMANIFHNWQRIRLQLAKTRTHQTVFPTQRKPQTATAHASVSYVKTSAISLLRCPTTSNSKITMTLNTSFLNSHPWSNQTVPQFCNCSSVPCISLHARPDDKPRPHAVLSAGQLKRTASRGWRSLDSSGPISLNVTPCQIPMKKHV